MIITPRRFAAVVATCAATWMVSWASSVPVATEHPEGALLRLTWRARPERIEHCVTQNPDALASLPSHMRQTTVCDGINASYRLEVRVDGTPVVDRVVDPGGLRRDRPLYVFDEVPIAVGDRDVRITFTRVETAAAEDDDEAHERESVLHEALPSALAWERTLTFSPRVVRIVSYDPERRELLEVRP